jgi:hypothetical protein
MFRQIVARMGVEAVELLSFELDVDADVVCSHSDCWLVGCFLLLVCLVL